MKIVNEADISIDRKLDESQRDIQVGELNIIPGQHKLLKQEREINLTNIEFRILYVLALHQGMTLSKEKIYNYVWDGEYLQDDSNITSHVRRLRKKIEDNPSQPEYIQTVRGVGYKMNVCHLIGGRTLPPATVPHICPESPGCLKRHLC